MRSWLTGHLRYWYFDSVSRIWREANADFFSSEDMASNSHAPLTLGKGDCGGPWKLIRNIDIHSPGYYPQFHGLSYGDASVNLPAGYSAMSTVARTTSELNQLGTTAIARSTPTNPYVNVASDVAEQIGAPIPSIVGHSLWRERTLTAKNAGDEYLNVEFGWLPLVSDIKKFAYAVKNSHKLLTDFQKGSGMKTRVGYHFPTSNSTVAGSYGNMLPLGGNSGNFGSGTVSETSSDETWFSGCFTYYVPSGDDLSSRMARYESYANHLIGVRLTPEVLWNATPWSWAADWFGDTGDVLRNIGNLSHDGLVMQYGYMMSHRRIERYITGDWGFGCKPTRYQVQEYKQRVPATPFGFGVNLSTLNATQIAIVTALGLSKGVPGHTH